MTRIEIGGVFSDRSLDGDRRWDRDLAALQGFTGGVGTRLISRQGDRLVVLLGLGPAKGWRAEDGYRAMATLADLDAHPDECDPTPLVHALSIVDPAATELVECGLVLAFGAGERVPSSGSAGAGALTAAATLRARRWTNAPAAELTPTAFAELGTTIAAEHTLGCSIISGEDLLQHGFGAIHAMGSGSPHPPALLDLRYLPNEPTARVTLVGKGVTFDTGGLSMKSPSAMAGMRQDKAGAATVLAVMSVLAELGVRAEVRALLPVIENMIGPHSLRPGDVVTSWNGTRIQVMDTDFEGRVILADALAYGCAERPDLIIDLATLTYQVVTALGPEIAGLVARDEAVAALVADAAVAGGEPLWRLPYADRYLDQVRGADGLRNHPEADSGRALTAALFLGQFVPDHVPWAHLDISGPAWTGSPSSAGATGFGVRTLLSLLRTL